MNNYGYVSHYVLKGHSLWLRASRLSKVRLCDYKSDTVVIEYFCHPGMTFRIANERLALIMEHA